MRHIANPKLTSDPVGDPVCGSRSLPGDSAAAYGTAWSKPHPLVGAARAGCFRYSQKLLPQELVPLKEKLSEGI